MIGKRVMPQLGANLINYKVNIFNQIICRYSKILIVILSKFRQWLTLTPNLRIKT